MATKTTDQLFLDYSIVTTSGGIILRKEEKPGFHGPVQPWEFNLGNYATVDDAQKAAVIYFMVARPNDFGVSIFHRAMGSSGVYHEWKIFRTVVERELIKMPPEITAGAINCQVQYKNKVINFKMS